MAIQKSSICSKVGQVHIWFPLRKQEEVHLFLLFSWLFLLFWTIREYSMSYYGRIWRKAHRFLSSESFDQWVKWSYEFEFKFDKERNYTFRSVPLNSLLDCRNAVVSFWLSEILLLLWVPLQWCFSINGSFMHLEVHTLPQNENFFWCSNHVCCFWIYWYYDRIVLNLITR